ncbi:MAG: S8 family peptidase [Clostridia bacterium]|nr:S8 family peptidase [Clostridia bacterium]
MDKKYLPIQFFEKRKDYDDRSTEGGGDQHSPNWVLKGDALNAHSTNLRNDLNNVVEHFNKRKSLNTALPMVVCTSINEKAIAKSHRSSIASLYATSNESNVLGFSGNRSLLSLVYDENVFNHIDVTLSDTNNQAKLISSVTSIEPFYPFTSKYEDESEFYKVRLINYNNYDLNNVAKIVFEQQCSKNNIRIERKTKFTSDMIIYRVCIDSLEQMKLIEDFEAVYSVEKLVPIVASLDAFDDACPLSPKTPDEATDYPIVGVLDTGISNNKFLKTWKTPNSHENYPQQYQDNSHGTFVAGIIEYGDELNGTSNTSLKGVKLFDATVYPDIKKETIYVDDLIEHIREAVEKNNNIKIWNLSLGTAEESSLDEFSDFGMALDSIQDENNVLIIKSAGNCTNFTKNLPKSRIAKSADSVRSLVVGSIAETQGIYDYSEPNTPSPFTRVGPGPSNIIKPDLVFYGGNAGVYGGRIQKTGVPSFSIGGDVVYDAGTSFSTPWVTRMAAEISYLMDEEFDPLLIKALLIHNAKYPAGCGLNMADKIGQMGFGKPSSVNDMLFNSSDEITLILRDTLDKGSFIEMFDFPYPDSLVDENGYFSGQIIVTLVTKSILDDKQAGEYCQSNIDIFFGTYQSEKDRDITKPMIKNPKGIDEAKNLLLDNCYSTRAKGTYPQNGFERECTLVKYGKKFHPTKKYAVDLSDVTPSNKKRYLGKDRKWYLKIEGLFRDFIEQDAINKNYQLSQEYCMLLTIRDPQGKASVYDEVTQQLDIKNFVHHNINLRNVIQIEENE